MNSITIRRALRTLMATTAICAATAGTASAYTLTVDDDKVQCPSAGYTSIQAAIDQAAPWDTIIVCDGLYKESGTVTTGTSWNPMQAGARSALWIDKPLTIKGAGASKVTIQPADALAPSLAGTAPYLRDGGGNVISVVRQSLGASDYNENFFTLSGVTVKSPTIYAEAGIAFFNTSGKVSNSVVGPLYRSADASELATKPHGWGIVMTNHLQGGGLGTVYRKLTVENSLITGYQSGGILFDDSRGTDAAVAANGRAGIIEYGYVTGTRVVGSGPNSVIPQTGIQYHAGARGSVTGSEITGNNFSSDPRKSVGLLLTDAETGVDPNLTTQRGFFAYANNFSGNGYGLFNADIANAAVNPGVAASATDGTAANENYFGCATGPIIGSPSASGCEGISGPNPTPGPSVELGATRTTAPAALVSPGVTADAPPTGTIVDPLAGQTVAPLGTINPVVVAADDFGVASVKTTVGSTNLGTDGLVPFDNFAWTAQWSDIGQTYPVTAVITDSSGQTTTKTLNISVPVPSGYVALTSNTASYDFGTVLIGLAVTKPITLTNTGQNPVSFGTFALTGSSQFSNTSTGPGACASSTVLAVGASCTLSITFTPNAEGAVTGSLSIPYTAPAGTGPIVIPFAANGHLLQTSVNETVTGSVPSSLTLTELTPVPTLGTFVAGTAADYSSTFTLGAIATTAAAQLTVADPSATATGHLVNGAFSLAAPLTVKATNAANPSSAFAPVGSTASPLTVLTYAAPISNDVITVTFKQSIGANEQLRAGTYAKTVVFTLSSATP